MCGPCRRRPITNDPSTHSQPRELVGSNRSDSLSAVRSRPMHEYPVKVGSMLFTMVDPHRGHEVAYTRWYERDHFYAGCRVGPWLFAGRGWVAPRQLRALRFPDDSSIARPSVSAG